MQLHPRHQIVEQAKKELGLFLIDWEKKHGLTASEWLAILSREIQLLASSCVTQERATQVEK